MKQDVETIPITYLILFIISVITGLILLIWKFSKWIFKIMKLILLKFRKYFRK